MRKLHLGSGFVAVVDDQDYERVIQYTWTLAFSGHGRYVRPQRMVMCPKTGRKVVVTMAEEILAPPPGRQVDHIDRDPLNNRRNNLRICTHAENQRNRGPFRPRQQTEARHSRFKGVSWDASKGKWRVRIKVNGRSIHGGRFDEEYEAARAYDELARLHHKEFAYLNLTSSESGSGGAGL